MELLTSHEQKESAVLKEYGDMLLPHVETSRGRMTILDINPSYYEAQRLDCYHVDGDPQGSGLVEVVAEQAEKRFPSIKEQLQTPQSLTSIEMTGEILKRGHNVILVTNHGDMIDIALAFAGVYSAIDKMGYMKQGDDRDRRHPEIRTGMIISKIISRLGYVINKDDPEALPTPAVDVLKLVSDDVMLSFPRTPSMEKLKIFDFIPDQIDRHNAKLRKQILERQESNAGYLLAVAGSGTTDKPHPNLHNVYQMGSLSKGTISMMLERNTYVLPAAVWLKDKDVFFELLRPRAVTKLDEAHQAMVDIQDALNGGLDERAFEYLGTQQALKLGSTALKS